MRYHKGVQALVIALALVLAGITGHLVSLPAAASPADPPAPDTPAAATFTPGTAISSPAPSRTPGLYSPPSNWQISPAPVTGRHLQPPVTGRHLQPPVTGRHHLQPPVTGRHHLQPPATGRDHPAAGAGGGHHPPGATGGGGHHPQPRATPGRHLPPRARQHLPRARQHLPRARQHLPRRLPPREEPAGYNPPGRLAAASTSLSMTSSTGHPWVPPGLQAGSARA